MPLDVIGAGFGRTGTESLKKALEILGFGPCYHMYEVLPSQERVDTWRGIFSGKQAPDWDSIFAGYRATVDWPAAHYWRELAAAYPHAKVILSVRSPESWLASMEKTILTVMRNEKDPGTIGSLLGQRVFDGRYDDPEHLVAEFRRHISDVQGLIGPDRLLTYELGSGWEPLCDFLGCPIPEEPYPSGNQSDEFHQRRRAGEAARKRPE